MPLTDEALRAAEPDGSLSAKYCRWCYADGQFVSDCTMEEMIEHCLPFLDEVNKQMPAPLTEAEYRQMMQGFFPMLKRWRK